MGDDGLKRMGAIDGRLDELTKELKWLRAGYVEQVARRMRAEARVAPAIDELDRYRETLRLERNPSLRWNGMRRDLSSDRPGHRDRTADMRQLAYYPTGVFNPYLEILYSRTSEQGWIADPLPTWADASELQSGDILHLHWTKFVMSNTDTEAEADESVDATLEILDSAIDRGVRFIWSVHESLPHECPYPDVEIRLRRALSERAELIHVLHRSTVEEVAHLYPLAEAKVFVVEHPLYSGFYPDYVSREAARSMLGLEDEVVMLSFGAIRPYKGLDRLVNAAELLRDRVDKPFRVLVAGPTYRTVDVQEVLFKAASDPNVSLVAEGVPDEYVHVLFRAADVSILPYRAFHNSGVAMLSLSFGTPLIVPENPVTSDLVDSGLVRLFGIDDDDALLEAMVDVVESPPSRNDVPDVMKRRFDPGEVAGQFAERIEERQ